MYFSLEVMLITIRTAHQQLSIIAISYLKLPITINIINNVLHDQDFLFKTLLLILKWTDLAPSYHHVIIIIIFYYIHIATVSCVLCVHLCAARIQTPYKP